MDNKAEILKLLENSDNPKEILEELLKDLQEKRTQSISEQICNMAEKHEADSEEGIAIILKYAETEYYKKNKQYLPELKEIDFTKAFPNGVAAMDFDFFHENIIEKLNFFYIEVASTNKVKEQLMKRLPDLLKNNPDNKELIKPVIESFLSLNSETSISGVIINMLLSCKVDEEQIKKLEADKRREQLVEILKIIKKKEAGSGTYKDCCVRSSMEEQLFKKIIDGTTPTYSKLYKILVEIAGKECKNKELFEALNSEQIKKYLESEKI